MAYTARVVRTSRETTAKERIALKNTDGYIRLDKETEEKGEVVITPIFWAIVEIHNDNSDSKDYYNYIVEDEESGKRYVTGSSTFWSAFTQIVDEMADEDEVDAYQIKIYRRKSKKYEGKTFITCSIV